MLLRALGNGRVPSESRYQVRRLMCGEKYPNELA